VHEVRITIKKLRYGLEIAQEARLATATALVRVLKRQQNVSDGCTIWRRCCGTSGN
jgi:CHAD domain-containing protein